MPPKTKALKQQNPKLRANAQLEMKLPDWVKKLKPMASQASQLLQSVQRIKGKRQKQSKPAKLPYADQKIKEQTALSVVSSVFPFDYSGGRMAGDEAGYTSTMQAEKLMQTYFHDGIFDTASDFSYNLVLPKLANHIAQAASLTGSDVPATFTNNAIGSYSTMQSTYEFVRIHSFGIKLELVLGVDAVSTEIECVFAKCNYGDSGNISFSAIMDIPGSQKFILTAESATAELGFAYSCQDDTSWWLTAGDVPMTSSTPAEERTMIMFAFRRRHGDSSYVRFIYRTNIEARPLQTMANVVKLEENRVDPSLEGDLRTAVTTVPVTVEEVRSQSSRPSVIKSVVKAVSNVAGVAGKIMEGDIIGGLSDAFDVLSTGFGLFHPSFSPELNHKLYCILVSNSITDDEMKLISASDLDVRIVEVLDALNSLKITEHGYKRHDLRIGEASIRRPGSERDVEVVARKLAKK